MPLSQKTCIVIAGPTAVGKTSLSIALARHFKTAVISADSRQCYKEMNIGVARPTPDQLQVVKHYFINSHSISEDVNAGVFEQYALNAAHEIFLSNDLAVMVGGTGLYIRAFCEGMDQIPAITKEVRNEVTANYQEHGLSWLQNEIKKQDPAWHAAGEVFNPQRMMRALEVVLSTGQSISSFHTAKKIKRDFKVIKIGLTIPREQLYHQIDTRVDNMILDGLENEVKTLSPYRSLTALQTVGYKELFGYLDGKFDLQHAIIEIKKNTRHYAKRQLTWFNRDDAFTWYSPLDYSQIIKSLNKLVQELRPS